VPADGDIDGRWHSELRHGVEAVPKPARSATGEQHICENSSVEQGLEHPQIQTAFRVPHPLLVMQFAADGHFAGDAAIFSPSVAGLARLRDKEQTLPRPLAEESDATATTARVL
jgi:hypothetical protein